MKSDRYPSLLFMQLEYLYKSLTHSKYLILDINVALFVGVKPQQNKNPFKKNC